MTDLFMDFGGNPDILPADIELAVAAYHKLDEHYPGHQWRTTADHAGGVLTVQLQYFDMLRTESLWGYRIKIDRLNGDPTMLAVVNAGGEMLERYGLSRERGGVDHETVLAALDHGLDV